MFPMFSRHYREKLDETPTHTGGVSREAKERMEERAKDKKRGLCVTSDQQKEKSDNNGKVSTITLT